MISASAVTTRHELIMSLVAGLSLINKVWKRAPQLNNDLKSVPVMARIFSYFGRCTEISLKFYGQTAIFDHFVRNRHFGDSPFTDKASIFIDLSVNDDDFIKCSAAHHLLNYCT